MRTEDHQHLRRAGLETDHHHGRRTEENLRRLPWPSGRSKKTNGVIHFPVSFDSQADVFAGRFAVRELNQMSKYDKKGLTLGVWRCDLYAEAQLQQACLTAFAVAENMEDPRALIINAIAPIQIRLYPGPVTPSAQAAPMMLAGRKVLLSRYAGTKFL